MEKFSYSLEFYKEKIYTLEDIDFYKRKVNEAEKVEKYFSNLIPNIEHIRPYIIMSYKLEKVIGYENRIRYVRGLIYASDYIDFIDAYNIPKDIDYFTEMGLCNMDSLKQSIWGYTAYNEEENTDDIISGNYNDIENEEEIIIKPTDNNNFEIKKEDIDLLINYVNDSINNGQINEESTGTENNKNNYNIESYISIEEKLDRFKKNSELYIENLLNDKLKNNIINENDIPMIKRAMKRWFKKVFYIIEKLLEFDSKEYAYNDQNIARFL